MMTFEVSPMSLLISKDNKQLSALWWHLKCHQWAYWFRRTRHKYLHYDDISSVIIVQIIVSIIDFEGPDTIICTMMTFEVSSMSLSILKDQKQLSALWCHLKCHQWAYWFRRTRKNYLHYDVIVYTEQPPMRLLISKDQKQLSALWWHLKCHQWAYRFEGPETIICTMMTFEVSSMSLLISKDQKQLSALWWHLKCPQWAYRFEGPETIICTMMTFEVSSMSLSISKDQKQLSAPWWHLKCHQWAYWSRRTRNNYLHHDDIWSVINELIDLEGPETIIYTMMSFEVSSMSLLISKDQKQLSSLWWHLKCHQWAYRFRRARNNYLHYDVIWSVIN